MSDLIGLSRFCHEEVAVKLEDLLVCLHSASSHANGRRRGMQAVLELWFHQGARVSQLQAWPVANVLIWCEYKNRQAL